MIMSDYTAHNFFQHVTKGKRKLTVAIIHLPQKQHIYLKRQHGSKIQDRLDAAFLHTGYSS